MDYLTHLALVANWQKQLGLAIDAGNELEARHAAAMLRELAALDAKQTLREDAEDQLRNYHR